jgi:hypothetical protein
LSRALTILLLCLGLWLTAIPGRIAGAEPSYSEEAIKAAYLHRFAAYVEWPGVEHPATAFTIGVLGADPVLRQLQRLLPAINVKGRAARVRPVATVGDLQDVSILYVGPGRLATARSLVAAAASRRVLVVTDEPGGLGAGGVINFVRRGPNVRFEVSQAAATRSGLKIDAALLGVAVRVETR